MCKFLFIAMVALASLSAVAQSPASGMGEFLAFLAQADAAQNELQDGKPAAYKALWSHADDVTLSGGFGGTIEKGWEMVSKRLDWAGSQFTNGTNKIERVTTGTSGDLAYLIQYEHIRFIPPGQKAESSKDYRVTMIFRRENGSWRIVHRHADSQMTKQSSQPSPTTKP
jgi:ketosteroid isomerase-like protein